MVRNGGGAATPAGDPFQVVLGMTATQVRNPGGVVAAEGLRGWVTNHPVVSFVLLAYAWSWSLWLIVMATGIQLLFFAGGFGPLVSAAAITRYTGGSVRDWARSILRWRVAPRYYLYALGLPIVVFGFMNIELLLLGYDVDVSLLAGRLPTYLSTFVLVAVVGGGLPEEPGWRGFALPRLQQRLTPVRATFLLGLVWGMWHVPLYGPLGFVLPMFLAFFYTWLYNRSGSVLLCILLHASFTPALEQLILLPDEVVHAGGSMTVDIVILGTVVAAAMALVAVTRGRLGFEPPREVLR